MTSNTTPPPVEAKWPSLHDAIWRAVCNDDLATLHAMLKSGADISEIADTHRSTDTTVLHTAIDGNVEVLDLLLHNGAMELLEAKCGPGEEGRWCGFTALQAAAKHGRTEIAQRLIAVGAEYDIFSAVALGDTDRITELLQQDENAQAAKDDYQGTLLHWAAARDQHEAARLLIERGAEVNANDGFDETPLLVASVRQSAHRDVIALSRRRMLNVSFDSIVDLLLDHGAKTDVFAAAALGNNTRLGGLLSGDRSLANAKNRHGTTPLHWAARNAQIESARMLMERSADIDAKDSIGCPPLWYAAYWGNNAAMTQYLCKQGADVSFRNIWGKDITAYDCGYGCSSIIRSHRK